MRELGVLVAFGITLGPEPRTPSALEKLAAKAAEEDTPQARRDLRVEQARQDLRDKLGHIGDIPDARIDALLDPAIFELD